MHNTFSQVKLHSQRNATMLQLSLIFSIISLLTASRFTTAIVQRAVKDSGVSIHRQSFCKRANEYYHLANPDPIQTFLKGYTINVAVTSSPLLLINTTTGLPYGGFYYSKY
jgi:hypothetical protein